MVGIRDLSSVFTEINKLVITTVTMVTMVTITKITIDYHSNETVTKVRSYLLPWLPLHSTSVTIQLQMLLSATKGTMVTIITTFTMHNNDITKVTIVLKLILCGWNI